MIRQFKVKVNKKDYHVEVEEMANEIAISPMAEIAKRKMENAASTDSYSKKKKTSIAFAAGTKCELKAPLPGTIGNILAKEGKRVQAGEKLLVLEAMKMENSILAPATGKVESISVKTGESVLSEQILLTIVC